MDPAGDGDKKRGKQSRKGKEREIPPAEYQRTVWVWVHPTVYEAVYVELRVAASFALEQAQEAKPDHPSPFKLEMADLREQMNVFEIMGPKSSQVIRGALRPLLGDERAEFKQVGDISPSFFLGALTCFLVLGRTVSLTNSRICASQCRTRIFRV